MKIYFFILVFASFAFFSCNNQENQAVVSNSPAYSISQIIADTVYYPNGKVKQVAQLKASVKNGFFIQFAENGDTLDYGNYENNRKNGRWTHYGGESVTFYENGDTTKGITAGPPDNRQVTELFFTNDTLREKIERVWFLEKNQIETETTTYYGKDTVMKSRSWHENGNLSDITCSINAQPNDTARSWRKDGTLILEDVYKRGKIVYMKEFDKSGKKVISITTEGANGKLITKK